MAKRTEQIEHVNKDLEEKMLLLEENINFQQQVINSAYSSLITLNQQGLVSMINVRAMEYLGWKVMLLENVFRICPLPVSSRKRRLRLR
ncbi:hypothetical protein RCO48_15685 [Peribacillus frigoritolerans]|nr:hypothetical protein [Peribacillus frigoritolerans]